MNRSKSKAQVTCSYLSIACAVVVIARGAYLMWYLFTQPDNRHYDALGVFMDYVVHIGAVGTIGLVLAAIGRSWVGAVGNISFFVLIGILFLVGG
jgi:hypothetical protein